MVIKKTSGKLTYTTWLWSFWWGGWQQECLSGDLLAHWLSCYVLSSEPENGLNLTYSFWPRWSLREYNCGWDVASSQIKTSASASLTILHWLPFDLSMDKLYQEVPFSTRVILSYGFFDDVDGIRKVFSGSDHYKEQDDTRFLRILST